MKRDRKFIGFETTPEVDKAVERERKRLAQRLPGSRVDKSTAVRSLIIRASTIKEKVGD